MVEQITGMLALIGVLSLFCQWIGWKLRLPAILPLLLCGLTLGPGFGVLNPDAIFGDLLFPIISLGVAVILFEGALTLNFKEIKDHGLLDGWLFSVPRRHVSLEHSDYWYPENRQYHRWYCLASCPHSYRQCHPY